MAQINITLSEQEVLEVITGNRDEALKFLLRRILNELMQAESEEQLRASKSERTNERTDYRNGTRERELNTRIGKITLKVPRHRSEPFHTMIFESYSRSEASLIATMVQMVICGVSTRKVEKVVQTLCGTSFSKSTVSKLCQKLDEEITAFKSRTLEYMTAPFLMVDATYFKVRENHHIVSKAFLTALVIKSDGTREIVDFAVHDAEDVYAWKAFLGRIRARGLDTVRMIISDSHKAIRKACADIYPNAAWQRCQVHLARNILEASPSKYKEGIKQGLRAMFTAKDIRMARMIKKELIDEYNDVAEKAMQILDNGFEDSMTVMCLPEYIRVVLRSTNILERLNRELKRRSDVIQIFPNADSVMRLMGAVAIEYSDDQKGRERIFAPEKLKEIEDKIYVEFSNIAKQQLLRIPAA